MRISLAAFAAALGLLAPVGLASASADELAPGTAAADVAGSTGVVLVDLYAHW